MFPSSVLRIARSAVIAALFVPSLLHAQTVTYTFTGFEPTMAERLFRDGNPSVAGSPKPFPGTLSATVPYTTFGFTNTQASPAVFGVDFLGTTGGRSFLSAYLGAFDPTNLASNYLGDSGSSCSFTPCLDDVFFSVDVGAGESVVLVLSGIEGDDMPVAGTTATFSTTGLDAMNTSTVPEPSTYALMASGLLAMAVVARRRRA